MTGAALMISAAFTFLVQVTVMQRMTLKATVLIRLGMASLFIGALIIASFQTFAVLGWVWPSGDGTGPVHAVHRRQRLAGGKPGGAGRGGGLVSSCPPWAL